MISGHQDINVQLDVCAGYLCVNTIMIMHFIILIIIKIKPKYKSSLLRFVVQSSTGRHQMVLYFLHQTHVPFSVLSVQVQTFKSHICTYIFKQECCHNYSILRPDYYMILLPKYVQLCILAQLHVSSRIKRLES